MSQFKVSVCGSGCGDIAVPNTGFITNVSSHQNGDGGMVGIGLFVVLVVVFGIIATVFSLKKKKHCLTADYNGLSLLPKRRVAVRFLTLVSIVAAISFVAINQFQNNSEDSFAQAGQNTDSLTITTSDVDLSVKIDEGQNSAFGYASSQVQVKESTQFGYKLKAYVNDDSLKSKTGDAIKSVNSKEATVLGNNTWGVALNKPVDQDSNVWFGMPTTLNEALTLKETDFITQENDTTTVYYGVKINNELSCGDYEGATINYVAIANVVPPEVTFEFQGQDTYFDENKIMTSNRIGYANTCVKSQGYIGERYEVLKTNNVDENGNWNDSSINLTGDRLQIPGADKLVVEVNYNLYNNVYLNLYGGAIDLLLNLEATVEAEGNGVARYLIGGDTVGVEARVGGDRGGTSDDGSYRYGYFVKIYPVYDNEQAGASYEELPEMCGWTRVLGDYKTPIEQEGTEFVGWLGYIDAIESSIDLRNKRIIEGLKNGEVSIDDVLRFYLVNDGEKLRGQTIVLDSNWEPIYKITFDGNGASAVICKSRQGTSVENFTIGMRYLNLMDVINCPESDIENRTTLSQTLYLRSGNDYLLEDFDDYVLDFFGKTGYKLIGWSTDPNAATSEYERHAPFTIPENPDNHEITLYAVWERDTSPKGGVK